MFYNDNKKMNYKNLMIELLFKLRILISIITLLGIDVGLNFNNEEENTESKSNKIDNKEITNTEPEKIPELNPIPKSLTEIDNNTSTPTTSTSTDIKPINEEIGNTESNNSINIEKQKEK
jgi:hypothetical protein